MHIPICIQLADRAISGQLSAATTLMPGARLMKNFRNLQVWRKAHELTLKVYGSTRAFPREELYGLTSQLRRSAVSIPSNIAEGCGRRTDPDFARFLDISMGSASELEYLVLLAHQLSLLDETTFRGLDTATTEVKRMLASLLSRLRADR